MAKTATIQTVGPLGTSTGPRRPPRPGLLLRARTRLLRHRLDNLIARAVERPGDDALALREAELSGERERGRAADRIEGVVEAAQRPLRPSAAVPIDRKAIAIAGPALADLAGALRSDGPVEPRGVALTLRLLTDACSPVYLPPGNPDTDREELRREVRRAIVALRPLGAGLPDVEVFA